MKALYFLVFVACLSTTQVLASCPPRPPIPSRSFSKVPEGVTKLIADFLSNMTLAPCAFNVTARTTATSISASVIFQGSEPSYINLGCVDKHTPYVRPTEHSVYLLASVSKAFVADLVARAVMSGRIRSLDEPFSSVVRDFFMINPFSSVSTHGPTWRQMLSQLGGLPRETPSCQNPCPNKSFSDIVRDLHNEVYIWPFGYRPSYSNLAFSLAGWAVAERVYNTTFELLLKSLVYDPLLLNETSSVLTPQIAKKIVQRYGAGGHEAPDPSILIGGFVAPAGGIVSSSADMAAVAGEWLRRYRNDSVVRSLFTTQYQNSDNLTSFGAPWETVTSHGYLVHTKGGFLPGSCSVLILIPELQFATTVLWNGQGIDQSWAGQQIADRVIPLLMDAFHQAELSEWPALPSGFADTFVGTYQVVGGTAGAIVTVQSHGSLQIAMISTFLGSYVLKPSAARKAGVAFLASLWAEWEVFPSCVYPELDASVGQYVQFGVTVDNVVTLSIPGYAPGAVFQKISSAVNQAVEFTRDPSWIELK